MLPSFTAVWFACFVYCLWHEKYDLVEVDCCHELSYTLHCVFRFYLECTRQLKANFWSVLNETIKMTYSTELIAVMVKFFECLSIDSIWNKILDLKNCSFYYFPILYFACPFCCMRVSTQWNLISVSPDIVPDINAWRHLYIKNQYLTASIMSWNCVTLQIHMWNPDPQYLRKWPFFRNKIFMEVIRIRWNLWEWTLAQYDCCPYKGEVWR